MEVEDIGCVNKLSVGEPSNGDAIEEDTFDPIHDIIDYLVRNNDICFKSQQIGEVDLTKNEKKIIAYDIYKKKSLSFLKRFGKYLKLEHLPFFENRDTEGDKYELDHCINELKIILNDETRKNIVRNRRFEALSKMIKETTYFSEIEMMQRNPLLYEQLVGQYLSENEKIARDNIDKQNITLLGVLLESIERNQVRTTLENQKNAENDESSASDDETDDEIEKEYKWGEFIQNTNPKKKKSKKKHHIETPFITASERDLLHEEFVQEMYRSFLDGEDEDFNYCEVDENSDYDCLAVYQRDKEEKYFDTESPEETQLKDSKTKPPDLKKDNDDKSSESDDELDIYMKHLSKHPTLNSFHCDNP